MNEEDITPNKINDSAETTQEGLNQILLGRNIDRVIAYIQMKMNTACLLYTSPSPRDRTRSRMPSSA